MQNRQFYFSIFCLFAWVERRAKRIIDVGTLEMWCLWGSLNSKNNYYCSNLSETFFLKICRYFIMKKIWLILVNYNFYKKKFSSPAILAMLLFLELINQLTLGFNGLRWKIRGIDVIFIRSLKRIINHLYLDQVGI